MDAERQMTLEEWVARLPPMHRAAREFAALRAQAKAEPVAWAERDALDDEALVGFGVARANHRDKLLGHYTVPLYTAPPPDHAEALVRDVEQAIGLYDDEVADEPDYADAADAVDAIRAALTRYKERTNG